MRRLKRKALRMLHWGVPSPHTLELRPGTVMKQVVLEPGEQFSPDTLPYGLTNSNAFSRSRKTTMKVQWLAWARRAKMLSVVLTPWVKPNTFGVAGQLATEAEPAPSSQLFWQYS